MITALGAALLVALTLAPLVWALRRDRAGTDRREAAITLHRAQLTELDRDLGEGRLAPGEHSAARLEVQRRLLAAADLAPVVAVAGKRWPALVVIFLVPIVASGLYMVHGQPGMPAMPLSVRMAEADRQASQADTLIRALREKLTVMDPSSERARQGYVLLGNAEEGRGNMEGAADAWRRAVQIRFEPGLAALAAEARTLVDGGLVDADSAELFARALSEGPKDAPWRAEAQKRLTQTGLR